MQMREGAVRLPDGRQLGFGEVGEGDTAVLHFPGSPGSRHTSLLDPAAVEGAGVRVLTLERPGTGLSTRQPGRRFLDWPADVRAFLDDRGIERVGVLATSAGGPYALACGVAIPERITRLALRSSVGPIFDRPDFDELQPPHTRPLIDAVRQDPAARHETVRSMVKPLAEMWNGNPEGGWTMFVAMLPESARAQAEADAELWQAALAATFGDPDAYADDRIAAVGPWEFDLADVEVPLRAWHGTADATAPIAATRAAVEAAGGELVECDGEGHFLSRSWSRPILDWLVGNASD